MKVLIVHNRYRSTQPSGENVSVDTEARLLAEHGCEIKSLELQSDEIASWPIHKRATLPFRVVWSREGRRLTEDAIRRFRPQVVHFQNTFPLFSPAALWAARNTGARVIQTLRNFRPLCPSADFLRDGRICEECLGRVPLPAVVHGCYRNSRVATLPITAMDTLHQFVGTWRRCVDVFITPSEFVRRKYVEAGWPPEKLVVKYNTVAEVQTTRATTPRGFVCISRLTSEKGIDTLLEAWRRAFPDGGEGLLIVGSGDAEAQLTRAASAIRGVQFRGQLPRADVMDLLAQCRAAVIPSLWYEPFGRVVAESFSTATPIIASRIGALAEIVKHGENGLLVPPGSSADLASALEAIASSDRLTRELGQRARADYARKFDPTVTTERLISIYRAANEEAALSPEDVSPVDRGATGRR